MERLRADMETSAAASVAVEDGTSTVAGATAAPASPARERRGFGEPSSPSSSPAPSPSPARRVSFASSPPPSSSSATPSPVSFSSSSSPPSRPTARGTGDPGGGGASASVARKESAASKAAFVPPGSFSPRQGEARDAARGDGRDAAADGRAEEPRRERVRADDPRVGSPRRVREKKESVREESSLLQKTEPITFFGHAVGRPPRRTAASAIPRLRNAHTPRLRTKRRLPRSRRSFTYRALSPQHATHLNKDGRPFRYVRRRDRQRSRVQGSRHGHG